MQSHRKLTSSTIFLVRGSSLRLAIALMLGLVLIGGASWMALSASGKMVAAPAAIVVVTPSNLNGWVVSNFDNSTAMAIAGTTTSGTQGSIVAGPATPPLGAGSFREKVGTDGDDAARLVTSQYNGMALTAFSALSYSTYVTNGTGQAPYLQLRIDRDNNGSTDDTLFFEPVYQNGTYSLLPYSGPVPNQCGGNPACVSVNTWQTWNTATGGWWSNLDSAGGPPLTTLAGYAANYPGAKLATDVPAFRVTSGFGHPTWANFDGNFDNLTVNSTTFDFDPPTNLYVDDTLVITNDVAPPGLSMGDTVTFASGEPGETMGQIFGVTAFSTITNAIAAANNGNTINVARGSYPENVSVSKSLTLLGANAGVAGSAVRGPESIIRTNGAAQTAVVGVTAANVTINGFTIDGDDPGFAGIALTSGDNTNASYGVRPTGAVSNLTVSNNIITKVEIGLRGDVASQGNVITRNWFDSIGHFDFGYAVSIRNNFYANVTDNKMTRSWTGVHINNHNGAGGPANFLITGNEIHSYAGGILYWLQFNGATGATINGNQITAEAGAVANNFGVLIVSNQDAINSTFTNNTITGHDYGIGLFNVPTSNTITLGATNSVTGSKLAGVFLTDNLNFNPIGLTNFLAGGPGAASTVNVTGLPITGNVNTGIKVEGTTNTTRLNITGATVSGGTTGLLMTGPAVALTGNTLNNVAFTGQSGNYITLANSALDNLTINATAVTFDGLTGATATTAQNFAIENKIFHANDDPSLGLIVFAANASFVSSTGASGSTPTATDNDYTRVNNAVQNAANGTTIKLNGTFNWTEANAAASWAKGSNGVAGDLDDYSILVPANLNNVTFTANALGDVTIQGPGDLPTVDLEGVFFFDSNNLSKNQGWTISNIRFVDFDLAIGMFFENSPGGAIDAFKDTKILNNYIKIAKDLNATVAPGDSFQNIGIHFSFGKDQMISGNTIEFDGDGISDSANSNFSTQVGMQSNTSGGAVYDGLQITNNTLRVLNAQSANPQVLIGIWENSSGHLGNVTVSGNQFTNLAGGNNPATNLQRAFRVTSHSSATTTVKYQGNTVSGANTGFQWLAAANFSGTQPVQLISNTLTGNNTGVLIQSSGSALLKFNRIVGNATGVNNATSNAINAENNWWGCNFGPGVGGAGCTGTPNGVTNTGGGSIDANPWLVLDLAAMPTTVGVGNTSSLTASLKKNSDGVDTSLMGMGTVPDGIPVSFAGTLGTVMPTSTSTTGGMANSTYTATGVGAGSASTTVDGQTTTQSLTNTGALAFVQQPTNTPPNIPITPPVTVQLKDASNNNLAQSGVPITISLSSGTGTLSGTLTQMTNASGLATFNNLSIDQPGVKQLTASGTNLTPAVSNSFTILSAPAIVYVDDNWVGTTPGADPDGGGPATIFGYDAFATIQGGVNGVATGGTVNVFAGTYLEDVNINRTMIVSGSGPATTTISGPIGGPGSTVAITANNVEFRNFKVTREGNTVAMWNDPNLNSAGLSIQGQAIAGANIHDNLFVQNRTGIDINNSNGHSVHNNVITDNRTGLIFRNQTDNLTVVENEITNNWTVGIVFLDGSGGTNSPVQTAANCTFFNNNLSSNWYGQIVDRQTGGALPAPGTNVKNFSGNWFGTNAPVITTANSAEPGYAAQIPTTVPGGTATPPGGQPDIAGPASANFDYTPYLDAGTDTNVETTPGRGTYGFQGSFNVLDVIATNAQTGATGRIQEGVNLVNSGGTVKVLAGTYTENTNVNKAATLTGLPTINGTLTASVSGAIISPGFGVGVVNDGSLSLTAGSALNIELASTAGPGSGHDQLNTTGTVSLGGATLNVTSSFAPGSGNSFIIINNDGADPVVGIFNGLPEGTVFLVSGTPVQISYAGGTNNNDVVLSVNCPAITLTPASLPGGAANVFYSQTISAMPPGGGYTFAVTGGSLPPGLMLAANGTLSGTPTTNGTYTFTVTATGFAPYNCTGSQTYTVVIGCPAITMSPATLPNATINMAYPTTITASPSGGNYTFALTSGLLPAGMTLNANGSFGGAPTQSGSFNFRITVTGFGGCTAFRDYTLVVECVSITLNPASLPGGTVGTGYSQSVSATPAGTYNYSVTSGTLPMGLSLNASTGAITGTPTADGTFTFTITASAGGCTGLRSYTVTIACATITLPGSLPPATAGVSYSASAAASPSGSYTYSLLTGNLPSGLTLNTSTGAITGMPTIAGTYNFTIKAQAGNCSGTQSYSLTVSCPTITVSPNTLPNGTVGVGYSQTLSATPATGIYTFAVTAGSLPPGLLLSVPGVLSGTPTANGTFNFSVTATGFGNCTSAPKAYTIVIGGGGCPTITLPNIATSGSVGSPYNESVAASPSGSYTYTMTSGAPPPGVTFYSAAALLYGYPTAAGSYSFTIKATDSNGCMGSRDYTVNIGLGFAPSLLPDATIGRGYTQRFQPLGTVSGVSFTIPAGKLPKGLSLATDGTLSGTPTEKGSFPLKLRVADAANSGTNDVVLQVNGVDAPAVSGLIVDPLNCTRSGSAVNVTATVSNTSGAAQTASFTATLPPTQLVAVPGTCTTNVVGFNCQVVGPSSVTASGTLANNQSVVINYVAQIADGTPAGAQVCVTSTASFAGGGSASVPACTTLNCPTTGPGLAYPASSQISDQKAGSVLIYNIYTSASDPTRQNTRISITNTDTARAIAVHLFFVDGSACSVADANICLTPNQTSSFLASDLDPGTTGYIVAVAVDANGCPTNYNFLIGDEYVKFSSGHEANLGAEAIAALPGGLAFCNTNSSTATLSFDGISYNSVPRTLAVDNIPSRADGNDTLLILNRIGGNLATGASPLINLFGILYNDTENALSFGFGGPSSSPGTCQFRGSFSTNFPRVTPRFDQFIPAGRSGWAKIFSQADIGLLGAVINFNPDAGTSAGAFNQGHNLHKLTLTTTPNYVIPVFPPGC